MVPKVKIFLYWRMPKGEYLLHDRQFILKLVWHSLTQFVYQDVCTVVSYKPLKESRQLRRPSLNHLAHNLPSFSLQRG